MDICYFHRPAWGGEVAVAAMNLISNTSALIIDLRRCPGGYPGMIALICSYLFGDDPVHLDSIYWRDDDITQQYWTLPFIPGKRYGDKPVYVLISKNTFSGGEAFAYILQTPKHATLVGQKTDGGAHATTPYRIHPHFEVSIPIGANINPITHDNWERKGVIPDISVSQEQALRTAYQMALKTIIESIAEPPSGPFDPLLKEAQLALRNTDDPLIFPSII